MLKPSQTREQASGTVVRFAVYVQPGASRTEVAGTHGGAVKIRIRARAQDGAANEAVRRFLAEILEVPLSCIAIDRGTHARRKIIAVHTSEPKRVATVIEQLVTGCKGETEKA